MASVWITTFLASLVSIFSSLGFWNFVMYKRQSKDDLHVAVLSLLHNEVYQSCIAAIKREYTTFEEFDNITSLYEAYVKLGGNGTGKALFEEYSDLEKRQFIEEE